MNKFYLMHKNDIVATVSIEENENAEGYLHMSELFNGSLLPYGTKSAEWETIDWLLTRWNDNRCIPLGRPNYPTILQAYDIATNAELLPYCYMCSLTDCYWFKPENSTITWEEVDFHKNGFSSNLYKHLFYCENDEPINHLNSPDITTNGALPKMWEEKDNTFILIKGHDDAPIEACYEVIADALLKELEINHVEYDLVQRKNKICSACECYINSSDEEFVPTESLLFDYQCDSQLDFLPVLVKMGFKEDIDKMFLADTILGNTDRHANNYGIIIDANTQLPKRFVPLFDHGVCCLKYDHSYSIYRPTGETFGEVMQKLEPSVLSLVENINFDNINKKIQTLPLEEQTKEIIKTNLRNRIDKLIELKKEYDYELGRDR